MPPSRTAPRSRPASWSSIRGPQGWPRSSMAPYPRTVTCAPVRPSGPVSMVIPARYRPGASSRPVQPVQERATPHRCTVPTRRPGGGASALARSCPAACVGPGRSLRRSLPGVRHSDHGAQRRHRVTDRRGQGRTPSTPWLFRCHGQAGRPRQLGPARPRRSRCSGCTHLRWPGSLPARGLSADGTQWSPYSGPLALRS